DERGGEPRVVRVGDLIDEGLAAILVGHAAATAEASLAEAPLGEALRVDRAAGARHRLGPLGLLAVAEAPGHGQPVLRILAARHAVLAERGRDQRDPDEFLFLEDRPFAAIAGEVSGEFMELLALPHVARMIVALSALNLDAEEDARGLGGDLGGRF